MQYSVCLPAVLSKMEVNEALAAVKAAGFEQYEIWGWWDLDMEEYYRAQQKSGMRIAGMCANLTGK